MVTINGEKAFNDYESALATYNKLDKAGYHVTLCDVGKIYFVSFTGYTETIPMINIER